MTRQRFSKTKLLTGLPSAVAGLAAIGAMTLVQREWAAQVGLLVYFPVLVLIGDRINRERLERSLEGWWKRRTARAQALPLPQALRADQREGRYRGRHAEHGER